MAVLPNQHTGDPSPLHGRCGVRANSISWSCFLPAELNKPCLHYCFDCYGSDVPSLSPATFHPHATCDARTLAGTPPRLQRSTIHETLRRCYDRNYGRERAQWMVLSIPLLQQVLEPHEKWVTTRQHEKIRELRKSAATAEKNLSPTFDRCGYPLRLPQLPTRRTRSACPCPRARSTGPTTATPAAYLFADEPDIRSWLLPSLPCPAAHPPRESWSRLRCAHRSAQGY